VAVGRGLDMATVDSIGQGRVWSGEQAVKLGLVDRIGGLQTALAAAAKMAKLTDYGLREYPEPQNIFDYFMGSKEETMKSESIDKELGPVGSKTYRAVKSVKSMLGVTQARLPFEFQIN
jgi:protease-4